MKNKAAREPDLKKRAEYLLKAEQILMAEEPWIPVMHYGTKNLISPKLVGFHQNISGVYPTRFLQLKQ
jgi:oligopeptide transport system substrate-binding protein